MKLLMSEMEKIFVLFTICSFIITYVEANPKKVCVLGAGRAGLAAIKTVVERADKFELVAYERNSDVGGLWIYTDKTDLDEHGLPVHSSVYKNLKTITPKEQMVYPDYRVFNTNNNSSYVTHQTFLKYMRNYTDHFNLRKHIQFNTLVSKVTPTREGCQWGTIRWQIENRNLNTNKVDTTVCDGIMICNGRFSTPNIPELPGIEKFSGRVLHSHAYRKPEDFANQTVIVWGSGASGLGITRDLSPHAKDVFLSYRYKFRYSTSDKPANVHVVKNVEKFDGRDFILEDNTKITADAFIYCTGYVYDFPFLTESSGIIPNKDSLYPLSRNFINKNHPSMAFIGLGDDDGRGDHLYAESKFFLSTLEGKKH